MDKDNIINNQIKNYNSTFVICCNSAGGKHLYIQISDILCLCCNFQASMREKGSYWNNVDGNK